jgi:FkbM family methyltransferase
MRKILLSTYGRVYKILSRPGIGRVYKILSRLGIGNLYPVKVINSFISYLKSNLKPNFTEVHGHKMFLDSLDTLALSIYGVWEPLETELIKKEIKRGDVVLDIGANIGYYTLIFGKFVGEEGKVFAFEPEPNNFALLKKNVEINGYKNVILVQKAVSNKTGKIRLYLNKDNMGAHTIYDSGDGHRCIEIEAIQLDDHFKDYDGKIDFIKMDIEGAEGGAIQGMCNLLNKNQNVKIITEFWPSGCKRFGIGSEEYLKLLLELGFNLYEINVQEKKIKPVNIPKLLEIYTPEKQNYTNILCVREK